MTTGFFSRMFGGKTTNGAPTAPPASDFETLNRRAPILDEEQSHASGQAGDATVPNGFICRETVLGRDQKVAGYHFMLQQATQQRLRTRTRQIHHVYADVLVRNILKLEIERLLAHRKAFVDLPDTFLDHPSVRDAARPPWPRAAQRRTRARGLRSGCARRVTAATSRCWSRASMA